VVTVLRLGKWVEFYVSENATEDQVKAAQQLMETVFAADFPPGTEVLSTEKAPVSVERTATTLKYSVPASTVEIEMMKGQDGKPIKILNLPFIGANEFIQYKSIKLEHNSKNKKFSYSSTNGFTAKMEATSKQ
jgi:DNA-binding GntR family transcriptional regulator